MFDSVESFGDAVIFMVSGSLIASYWLGIWGGFGAVVGSSVALYYTLHFYNKLEERDRRDFYNR